MEKHSCMAQQKTTKTMNALSLKVFVVHGPVYACKAIIRMLQTDAKC